LVPQPGEEEVSFENMDFHHLRRLGSHVQRNPSNCCTSPYLTFLLTLHCYSQTFTYS
ncbi:hypothetical protein T4D_10127, partial [Trichinella pseudospiralis]